MIKYEYEAMSRLCEPISVCICKCVCVCVCVLLTLWGQPFFLSPHNVNHKVKVMVSLKEIQLNVISPKVMETQVFLYVCQTVVVFSLDKQCTFLIEGSAFIFSAQSK